MEESKKETLKDIFFAQLQVAATDLIKSVVNAKSLGYFIIFWFLFSVGASVYRRADTITMPDGTVKSRCEITVPLDTYFMAKMLCPIK
jgi:hypothetical protein